MSSIRSGLVAVAVLAFLAIQAAPVAAQETSAANCGPRNGAVNPAQGGTTRLAQTFTPSISGTLTRAWIGVDKTGTAAAYVVSLNAVDGSGTPTNTVLATTTVADSFPDGNATLDAVFGAPASVVASQTYALVLTRPGSDNMTTGARGDCPGDLYFSNDGTSGFQDYGGIDMVFTAFVTRDDSDGDGVPDVSDNCPVLANPSQVNTDSDAQGDACDTDDDNDTVNDGSDSCPTGVASGLDSDGDGCKDAGEDADDDNDGVGDSSDSCPTTAGAASSGGCQVLPDIDPPETTITEAPKGKGTRNKVTYNFAADEPGSTFECKLDSKPWKPCSSPRKYKVKEGKHKFKVRATDAAGNVDPTPEKSKFQVVGS